MLQTLRRSPLVRQIQTALTSYLAETFLASGNHTAIESCYAKASRRGRCRFEQIQSRDGIHMSAAKFGRFEFLRSLSRRKLVLCSAALIASTGIAFAAVKAEGHAQNPATLDKILDAIAAGRQVSPRVSLPLQVGFFNGATALYITPEVGVDPNAPAAIIAAARQVAAGFNSNFIPQNFGILPGSSAVDDIFVFTNFHQGNVLASAPHPAGPGNTDTNYSPLWQVNLVSWNSGRQPRALTSQTDILDAVAAGDIAIQKTPIIVECSVIFTPGGGQLPGSRISSDEGEGVPGGR